MSDKRLTVLGWYGHGNCGDESYKDSFRLLFPGWRLHFTNRADDEARAGDAVVMGGGNIVSPHFLGEVEKLDMPRYLMSASVTPGLVDLAAVGRVFDRVFVREPESVRHLAAAGVAAEYLPDFAFALSGDAGRGRGVIERAFRGAGTDLYKKVVAVVMNANVVVRNDLLARDWNTFDSVCWRLAQLIDSTSASFVFVPFGCKPPHDDRIVNGMVAGRCKWWKKNAVVYEVPSVQDTLDVLAAADCVISSRLHSSIFSCVGGTPFVDLTHHAKNEWFLKSVGREEWSVPYWRYDGDKAARLLEQFLSDPTAHRAALREVAAVNKSLLTGVANHVRLV